jgi:hypothetical protein
VTKNALGMLVLLAMASTVTSQLTLSKKEFKRNLGTPLIRLAAPGAKAVEFECRRERVFPIEADDALKRADSDFFKTVGDGNSEQVAQQYNARKLTNAYYTFEFKAKSGVQPFPNEPALLWRPRDGAVGETLGAAKKPGSVFRKRLEKIAKGQDVVYLRVWPDSFAFFRELRDWLQMEGHVIGWDPANRPLTWYHPRFYLPGGRIRHD